MHPYCANIRRYLEQEGPWGWTFFQPDYVPFTRNAGLSGAYLLAYVDLVMCLPRTVLQ